LGCISEGCGGSGFYAGEIFGLDKNPRGYTCWPRIEKTGTNLNNTFNDTIEVSRNPRPSMHTSSGFYGLILLLGLRQERREFVKSSRRLQNTLKRDVTKIIFNRDSGFISLNWLCANNLGPD